MSWLETIDVRTAGMAEMRNALKLIRQIEWSQIASRSFKVKMYRSAFYESDLSIHIHWCSDSTTTVKSSLGFQLANQFKRLGLVNHSVWTERNIVRIAVLLYVFNADCISMNS